MIRRRILQEQGDDNFVDLGLSVKWAKGNICKDSNGEYYIGEPTDYGCYYQWGLTYGYNIDEDLSNISNSYWRNTSGNRSSSIPMYDVTCNSAFACLGVGHRMPTKDEFKELVDNCTKTYVTTYNGIQGSGWIFKSNKAGYTDSEIFIPQSGRMMNSRYYSGCCYTWSSTYSSYGPYYLYLDSSTVDYDLNQSGSVAAPIRAVSPKAESVDLGLPSGTKWATYNLGATSETEYGTYYKFAYLSSNEDITPIEKDNIANAWGAGWYTPTKEQCQELIDYTTYTWETNFNGSGINGGKFTASNGKYVFIPAGGYKYEASNGYGSWYTRNLGSYFYVWTANAYNNRLNKNYNTAYWFYGLSTGAHCSTYLDNRDFKAMFRGVID